MTEDGLHAGESVMVPCARNASVMLGDGALNLDIARAPGLCPLGVIGDVDLAKRAIGVDGLRHSGVAGIEGVLASYPLTSPGQRMPDV